MFGHVRWVACVENGPEERGDCVTKNMLPVEGYTTDKAILLWSEYILCPEKSMTLTLMFSRSIPVFRYHVLYVRRDGSHLDGSVLL